MEPRYLTSDPDCVYTLCVVLCRDYRAQLAVKRVEREETWLCISHDSVNRQYPTVFFLNRNSFYFIFSIVQTDDIKNTKQCSPVVLVEKLREGGFGT